jgi:molybdopterin synthase catalytic subunit
MRVRILFFGVLKEIVGKSIDLIDLPEGASVSDVLAFYGAENPRLKETFSSLALAVNQEYSGPDAKLKANDEIALLPPVSGGSAAETPTGQPAGRRRYASIIRETIDAERIVAGLKRGEDGAALIFEGIVRNQTRGRKTEYLDYEAYEEMALGKMESLAGEALQRFQIRDVAIVHRLGRIEIGQTSVVIAVVSAHRAAAFEACRWLIDALKRTIPIWKKEHFEDGAIWADGEPFPAEIRRANS